MSYTFYDAAGSVRTADSSIISGTTQRPILDIGSILSAFPISIGNTSVSGTVSLGPTSIAALQGTNPWIIGNSSVQVVGVQPPSSVSGVGLFNVNHIGNGSVIAVLTNSSVAALQGTNPWVTLVSGSVAAILPGGSSVIAVLQANSIAGTYTEDSAHTTNERGIFTLGVRNDNMASVTSANGDYSPITVGPIGETLVANAPIINWIQAQTSVMYGTSVQAIAPQGSSVYTYVTGVQVANDSATFSRVKFTGGLGSVLAWTVAPANGGSNIVFANPLKIEANTGFSASISGVSSIYLSAQGFTSRT